MDELELYNGAYIGPQIDEAIGKALNPDATPTQNSTALITSGGVKSAITKVETDLASIQATGTTNTTGSTISAGTYFYLNGVLVQAITDIGSGATFTSGTNYAAVTAGGLNQIGKWEDVSSQFTVITSEATFKAIVNPSTRIVKVFFLADGIANTSIGFEIPSKYAPKTELLYKQGDFYRLGYFLGRFNSSPTQVSDLYTFHSFARYYAGTRRVAFYYPVSSTGYAITLDIEYVY